MTGTLAKNDVHVWYCFCDDPVVVERQSQYRALLTDDEVARRERFAFAKDRQLFLVARTLLRTTLSRYAAVEPAAWRFAWTAQGKPFLPPDGNTPPLHFNVSHSGKIAACAVTLGHEVGVDVESMTGRADLRVAAHFLSPGELARLDNAEAGARRTLFYRYWTLKESYAKALGKGLSMRFTEFSFLLDEQSQPVLVEDESERQGTDFKSATSWYFHQQMVAPHYCLAVAAQRPSTSAPVFTIRCEPPCLT